MFDGALRLEQLSRHAPDALPRVMQARCRKGAEIFEPASSSDLSIRSLEASLMPSRYFFNLTDGHDVIPDEDGIEVSDDRAALIQAFEAIEELRRESNASQGEWEGWRLNIMDGSGRLVHSLALDDAAPDQGPHN
jgi:hypothetical protein